MRPLSSSALALATFLTTAQALALDERGDAAPKAVLLPIERRQVDDPVKRDQQRRQRRADDTVLTELDNLETLYIADASLGTPPQKFKLHIDTGSSDLWVNAPDSRICQVGNGKYCNANGAYSANDSSTYTYLNSAFEISYVDGSGASGDYATDTFRMSGVDLEELQFGIGYKSTSREGILGIGYTSNEAQVVRDNDDEYENVPAKLQSGGDIETLAYSLWLNDLDANTGSILFGGVDTAKYHGSLKTLPIIKEDGGYREFLITMTDLGYNGKADAIFKDEAFPTLLDTGSSLTYLPNDVANYLYSAVNAQFDPSSGAALVSCQLRNSAATLDFGFSGVTIKVPMNELVLDVGNFNTPNICVFGISSGGASSTIVLGDSFLRSAYVVYDLEHHEISLAQTNFFAKNSNVKTITKDAGVPNAQVVKNPATPTGSVSGGNARNGLPPSLTKASETPGAAAHLDSRRNAVKAAGAGLGAAGLAAWLAI